MGRPANEGQLKSEDSAPDFAKTNSAPEFVKDHERAHSPNTLDPANGKGKDTTDPKQ